MVDFGLTPLPDIEIWLIMQQTRITKTNGRKLVNEIHRLRDQEKELIEIIQKLNKKIEDLTKGGDVA